MDASSPSFIRGMIILWYGAIADIPGGWVLCDGSGITPNLQNVFVVGAGDTYAVDAVGGAATHLHSLTSDNHVHELPGGSDIASGANFSKYTNTPTPSGTTNSANGLPPYCALAYIMKI